MAIAHIFYMYSIIYGLIISMKSDIRIEAGLYDDFISLKIYQLSISEVFVGIVLSSYVFYDFIIHYICPIKSVTMEFVLVLSLARFV